VVVLGDSVRNRPYVLGDIATCCRTPLSKSAAPCGRVGSTPTSAEQEKLAHVVHLGHTAGLLPADFGLAQIEPLFATFAANLQASRAYAPEPYTGRLTLWVSEATAASYAAALDAWSRLVPAGLDRTILPGDHYSLLRRPEVERLARELTAQLVRIPSAGRRQPCSW